MRRIAFINEKGGTCKTTLCVHVAARLAARGLRVLVADLDTQGHAGKSLGVDVRGLSPTVHEWLLDDAVPLERVVRPTAVAGLDLLPANKDLAGFPVAVAAAADRAERLDRRLATVGEDRYDAVLIDAPPSLSLVTENVLRAARELVVPVALTYLALDGCAEIVQSLERLRAERGAAPALALVVPTLYRKTQLADEILAKLRERFPGELSRTVLGWSVKVDEAQSHGLTVFEHAPRSSGAVALAAIGDEVLARAPAPAGVTAAAARAAGS
ncbi:Cobyrinic acid ac-diamide synthase [Anaeromyxobacter sp. K]|uniref:ParA family protein n=1 Tax=Anaeromyxobacter sp. (strain K) TaxID=447217 RepID=UPI00015F8CB4|nr:ParA family protein [Anaeromyxobacter sp. K]ACG72225.1 Cobyrinic acid ac-diamide synthase [Anaeromyxobacter sp. K]